MSSRTILIVFGVAPFLLKGELLPIRTYYAADGLAGDHINCIVPDSRGFIWFCTPEGLSRFEMKTRLRALEQRRTSGGKGLQRLN
jgi:hypothetical protein